MTTIFDLHLAQHCIETEVKRLHNRLISQYFKLKKPDAALEEKIEMLEKALKQFDFPMLRSTFSDLAGNNEQAVQLAVDSDGRYQIFSNNKLLYEIKIQ